MTSTPDSTSAFETPIPATMRVSVLDSAKSLRVEERDVPAPGPLEVLIKIASVGICGSDVHYYEHGRIADYVVRKPLVLGHEAGGTIVAVGEGVSSDRIGERVALEPGVPCRRCLQCKAGRYNLCPDVQFFATPPVDGVFSEYALLAEDFAHTVPENVTEDGAALIEPLSVGLWACQKAQLVAGSSLLIAGAGPVGVMTAQVARARGATTVIVTDLAEGRRESVLKYGATEVRDPSVDSLDDLEGQLDAFIDCSGAEPAITSGFPTVRGGGHIVLVGMGADELTIPVGLVQGRELNLTGSFRYANTYPPAIALAATGAVELDSMVTGYFSLDEVEEALLSTTKPGTIKSVVRPGPAS